MNARAFSARLSELLRREHDSMADFLVALADFDRRRLWMDQFAGTRPKGDLFVSAPVARTQSLPRTQPPNAAASKRSG